MHARSPSGVGRSSSTPEAQTRWRPPARAASYTQVAAIPGDIADEGHRRELLAALDGPRPAREQREHARRQPAAAARRVPTHALEHVFRVNVVAPLALVQLALPRLAHDARILNVSSDAAVEAYEGWGAYGASKAALDQLTNVLAAERDDVRVYSVDPGDMNTQMQQDAYPGEDVSDRPLPEESVPGLLTLIEGELPSGRYAARDLALPVHA